MAEISNTEIKEILDTVLTKLEDYGKRVDRLESSFDRLSGDMGAQLQIWSSKQQNSLAFPDDDLVEVPDRNGQLPSQAGVAFPSSINQLFVGGNETLVAEPWSVSRSQTLLKFYDQALDPTASETDTEGGLYCRKLRRRVARAIGVTCGQIEIAYRLNSMRGGF